MRLAGGSDTFGADPGCRTSLSPEESLEPAPNGVAAMKSRFAMRLWTGLLTLLLALDPAIAWALLVQETGGDAAAEDSPEASEAEIDPLLPDSWLESMQWRNIGPANMGGRITSIAVAHDDSHTYWIGTAGGGLLKTTNNGIDYEHQFEDYPTSAIGDVQVAPSDSNILWVGTGEANPRNSVSWGNGVYKSIDGGETWEHKGLDETFQIGRIAIHPENPDVVYVGALGRLWGPNEQRGLFKTADGGDTWEKVLYLDDLTGVIDVKMKPDDPETLVVATYERQRDGFDTNDPKKKWGPGSGLHRTTDGGATWQKLTEGLPTRTLGRIGIDWYASEPNVIFAVVESERITQIPEDTAFVGVSGENAGNFGARITEIEAESPAATAELEVGDVVIRIEDDAILSYATFVSVVRKYRAGATVRFEVVRDGEVEAIDVTFTRRPEEKEDEAEGEEQPPAEAAEAPAAEAAESEDETSEASEEESTDEEAAEEEAVEEEEEEEVDQREIEEGPFSIGLGGQRENVQEQQGEDGFEYGGVYRSDDAGLTWKRINSLNPRPMYYSQVRVDPSDDQYVYILGTQLYRSKDGGETFTSDGGRGGVHVDHHALWIDPTDGRRMILGNDGGIYVTYSRMDHWDHHNHVAIGQFYRVATDATRDYRVYGGLQDNGSWGGPNVTRNDSGPVNEDWFRVGGGDGFVCAVDRDDPNLVYSESQNGSLGRLHLVTGERAFLRPRAPRGTRYRFNWNTPFMLSHHNTKIYYAAGNHVFRSLDRGSGIEAISPDITATDRGSATALAESPRDAKVLYVGTDDGAVFGTRDNGATWQDLYSPAAEEPSDSDGRRRGRMRRGDRPGGEGSDERPAGPAGGRRRGPRAERSAEAGGPPAEGRARGAAERPTAAEEETGAPEQATEATADDPLTGTWKGNVIADMIPEGEGGFTMLFRRTDEGAWAGSFESEYGDSEIDDVSIADDGESVTFTASNDMMSLEFKGKLSGNTLKGSASAAAMGFSLDFEATREIASQDDAEEAAPTTKPLVELVPERRWVSSIEASRAEDGRVYLTLDGHRSDDDEPYVFVSEDYGKSWRSIRSNLPTSAGTTREIREDLENPNVLYLGCEFSAWVSIDRGETWTSLNTNLPTVAVHDIDLHPTSGELIAATHGRSLWILDVSTLRQLSAEAMKERVHLYEPNTAVRWRSLPSRGGTMRAFKGENPASNGVIAYSLASNARNVRLEIMGRDGRPIRTLDASGEAGLHHVSWDLRLEAPPAREGRGGRRFRRRGQPVESGTYGVALTVDGTTYTTSIEVTGDPSYADDRWMQFDEIESPYDAELEEGPRPVGATGDDR